ncbi:hypothetical protein BSPLISOX_1107 [uncultured Gammaproteobacteria bacterium]|nr:hypothetical protein [uncultured Gammaproteobacteria bacterium]VVH64386.1 hypothetical protein BSPLISOX_1107 [uncultured Gammaproteobacteria bacterium]
MSSPDTKRVWLDRNLGATRAATSRQDSASYGDLYQWRRPSTGHEKRNSGIITSRSPSPDIKGAGNLFISGSYSSNTTDWVVQVGVDEDGKLREAA